LSSLRSGDTEHAHPDGDPVVEAARAELGRGRFARDA
jgi:hypothetical protein